MSEIAPTIVDLTDAELEQLYEDWVADPVLWANEVLGFEAWEADDHDSQADIIRAVTRTRRITVRSGHKTGKSSGAAIIALWFWTFFPGVRVVITAPTRRQVDEVIWREVRARYLGASIPLGEPSWIALSPESGLNHPDGRQIIGLTATSPEAFSGISAPLVVYIVDEASGVSPEIFEAIKGNMAGGGYLILFSNPTQVSGEFYESHTTKSDLYNTYVLSSEYVARNVNPHGTVPGLASLGWLEDQEKDWQRGTPAWSVRVDGDFPELGDKTVISLAEVAAAQAAWKPAPPEVSALHRAGFRLEPLFVGVDVARFGDDKTVAIGRRGKWSSEPLTITKRDGPGVGIEVLIWLEQNLVTQQERTRVTGASKVVLAIDEIGVGASAFDWLRHNAPDWLEVVGVNVGEKALDEERYVNLRSELYFATRDWLRSGGMISKHAHLRGDLLGVRYSFDPRGRFRVESKDDIKERIQRSPDHGDALMLAVHAEVAAKMLGRGSVKRIKIPGVV